MSIRADLGDVGATGQSPLQMAPHVLEEPYPVVRENAGEVCWGVSAVREDGLEFLQVGDGVEVSRACSVPKPPSRSVPMPQWREVPKS